MSTAYACQAYLLGQVLNCRQDTFISGWEEGGELNALISVKSKNKSKATTIKAAIEGRLGTPALTGKVSGSVDIEKSDAFSESETTISR